MIMHFKINRILNPNDGYVATRDWKLRENDSMYYNPDRCRQCRIPLPKDMTAVREKLARARAGRAS